MVMFREMMSDCVKRCSVGFEVYVMQMQPQATDDVGRCSWSALHYTLYYNVLPTCLLGDHRWLSTRRQTRQPAVLLFQQSQWDMGLIAREGVHEGHGRIQLSWFKFGKYQQLIEHFVNLLYITCIYSFYCKICRNYDGITAATCVDCVNLLCIIK